MGEIEVKHDPQVFRTLDALDDHDLLATTQGRPSAARLPPRCLDGTGSCEVL